MEALYARLLTMSGWKSSPGPGTQKLTRTVGPSKSRVVFGRSDHLLRELWLKDAASELRWQITYGAPKPSFSIPADARRVSAFTLNEAPPNFKNAEAKSLYRSMITAAAKLQSGTVIVREANENVRVSFQGSGLREGRSNIVWVFDGTNLAVHNVRAKRYYRGKARRSDVLDLVTKLGGRVDAFTRYVLLRRVPFKDVIPLGSTLSVGGSMSINGKSRTILRSESPRKRLSFSIDPGTHLPASILIEVRDGSRIISTSSRTFDYLQVNKSLPKEEFRLMRPSGVLEQPLPKL
jgi:hypothetical protein